MHDSVDEILSRLSLKFNSIFYDREFVGCVKEDFDIILQNGEKDICVLFPRLKPIFLKALRYQAVIFGLKVFCIGEGPKRVAVVCKKSLLLEETNDYCQSKTTRKTIKDNKTMEEKETTVKNPPKRGNRASRPTQRFYVPPARRVNNKKSNSSHCETNVPELNGTSVSSKCHLAVIELENKIKNRRLSNSSDEKDLIVKCIPEVECNTDNQKETKRNSIDGFSSSGDEVVLKRPSEFNDVAKCETSYLKKTEKLKSKCKVSDSVPDRFCESVGPEILPVKSCNNLSINHLHQTLDVTKESTLPADDGISNSLDRVSFNKQNQCNDLKETSVTPLSFDKDEDDKELSKSTSLYISFTDEVKDDGDSENKRIQKTIENINRRSKPLIKHIQNDYTLQIESDDSQSTYSRRRTAGFYDDTSEETSLSSWEDMFDQNGDLQREYVGEIAKRIGCDVQIVKATNDYSSYQNMLFQDLEHVIELYDFPSSFKTQDLIQLYSDAYQDTMYVKWCDDTHALLVLSTPAQAQRALNIELDIIKSRPLTEASRIAALVASCTDLKPAMKRPQTNMQTARRLINTHLGTKIKLSKEALEQERKILISAREQRKLERQSEKDAWEGNPRNRK